MSIFGKSGGVKLHTHQHISPVGMAGSDPYVINAHDGNLDSIGSYSVNSIVTADRRISGAGGAAAVEISTVTSSSSSNLSPYTAMNVIIKA